MLKSNLFSLLRLFKSEEMDLLDQLIDTTLFKLPNRHTDSVRLFRYLKPIFLQPNEEQELDKKSIARLLFGHRANPDTELRKAMSNLTGILKKFVQVEQVLLPQTTSTPDFLRDIKVDLSLLQWLKSRTANATPAPKLSFIVDHSTRKSQLLVEHQYQLLRQYTGVLPADNGPGFNQRNYSEWLLTGFWNEYEMFDYYGLQRLPMEQERHMIQALAALDQFYYQLKMSLVVHLQTNQMMRPIQETFESSIVQNQIVHAQQLLENLPQHLRHSSSIQLYSAAYAMLSQAENGEVHYLELEKYIGLHARDLPNEIIMTFQTIQRIYCSVMYNQTGKTIYLQRNFAFFTQNLEQEIKQQGGTISALSFSAAISNALRIGQENHEWVIRFLQRFQNGKNLFGTETPREVYKTNRANLLLSQHAYREASNELIGYEWYGRIDEPQILLLAIRIDLKIQYEMGKYDDDYTMRTLDNAEKRILRLGGIDQQQRDMTLSFLRLLKQLCLVAVKLKMRRSKDGLDGKITKWQTEINSKPIAEKAWLLQKLKEIIAG
jgi:hypothetical protein